MTFYGLERPIEYGRQLIFDPTTALMVLEAQQQYANAVYNDYQQGILEMKEFNKEYGNFMSPITADQEWWNNNVTKPVQDLINDAYANGVDLLRSPQGRAMISRLIASRPYGDMAFKKQRADNAREYYKNAGVLAALNKYDKDFALFLGEDPNLWAENYAGVTAPTLFLTLKEATNDWYNNRTARSLSPDEVPNYDRRYDYTGFLDKDLMNIARNQTPGWQGSPQAKYYRELARRQVIARGENPTQDKIEAQLQRNIADAQQEWLINPIKSENKYELQQLSFRNQLAILHDAQKFQKDMARQAAQDKLDQIRAKAEAKGANGGKSNPESQNYSLTESLHHDLLFQGIRNSGIPVMKLTTDDKGNVVPAKDKSGKPIYINPEQASWNELEYAANHNNSYVYGQLEFFRKNTSKYAGSPETVERLMKQRYGSRITGILLASMLKRQVLKDGSVVLSSGEAKLLRGSKGITSDAIGSTYNITHNERLAEISNKINTAIKDNSIIGDIQIKFNLTDTGNNAVQISEKFNKGRTEVYANGTITVTGKNDQGKQISKEITTDAWLPLGLNSENVAGNNKNTVSNLGLASNNQSAYGSIDANYMKAMGQLQKANIGLFANSGIPMMIDPDNIDMEDLIELIQNN